jgi:predicted O-linked N-acetylglucosamine transferase (SPINDLY family)
LGVFLRKPAPVQVTAWGYATGTGLDTMDYFLGDAVATPMELARYFSETIVHLPAIAVYSPPEGAPAPSGPPAYTNGHVTFGSFNRAQKLSEATIALWARVLRCVPDSRLMLKSQGLDQPPISGRLVEAFGRHGVERDRLILTGGTGRSEHLAAHGNVDIALDPIPHGGGVTALESLWMGVPSITAPGDRVQSRLAASFLTTLDLCGFVAHNEDEFVELATTWAARLDELAEIRATLRERMAGSILCDGPAYCRAVEAAYRTMWRTWCERSTI